MVSVAGATAAIASHMPKKSSFSLGKFASKALFWAFPAATVFAASKAYGFERNTNGEEVKGTNWECGNKAMLNAALESVAFMAPVPMLLKFVASWPPYMSTPATIAINVLAWTVFPELIKKFCPDVSEEVNEACKQQGISYRAPSTSLFGNLGREGLTA